jgi:hypothetical protein
LLGTSAPPSLTASSIVRFLFSSSNNGTVDGFSVTLRSKSCSHVGNVLTYSLNVVHVVGCGVASMGLFKVSRSEHRSRVAVSRSTVTGIASMSCASLGFKQTYPCASLLVIYCAEKTTLTTRRNTAANKSTNHIHKEDQVLITYTNIQVVTRQVQHDNRYNTTKAGLFSRNAVYHLMCLLRSLPSGSSSGYLLENITALADYNDRQYNPCNTNMSTGKDLSPLSLTVDT